MILKEINKIAQSIYIYISQLKKTIFITSCYLEQRYFKKYIYKIGKREEIKNKKRNRS